MTARRTYTPARHRRYTYGLSTQAYEALVAEQRGVCPVCGGAPELLVVDHAHRTGAIRGLLCDRCNRAIGHLLDSPGVCRRAEEYLRGSVRPTARTE